MYSVWVKRVGDSVGYTAEDPSPTQVGCCKHSIFATYDFPMSYHYSFAGTVPVGSWFAVSSAPSVKIPVCDVLDYEAIKVLKNRQTTL